MCDVIKTNAKANKGSPNIIDASNEEHCQKNQQVQAGQLFEDDLLLKSVKTSQLQEEEEVCKPSSTRELLGGVKFEEALVRKAFPYDRRTLSDEKSGEVSKLFRQHLTGQIIVVDGIIGAGKSTFCKILKKTLTKAGISCVHFPEYVNNKYLSLFLSDQSKYAFAFQTLMLEKRGEIYREALRQRDMGNTVIIDRSLHGDMAFELMFHKTGKINKAEHEAYLSELSRIGTGARTPDIVLYLDVSTDVAKARVQRRGRLSESDVYDVAYHTRLSMVYNDLMNKAKHLDGLLLCRIPYDVHSHNFAHYHQEEYKDACVAEMSLLWVELIKNQIASPKPNTLVNAVPVVAIGK